MRTQKGFEDPAAYRHGVLSIGNFDGVHRGHQTMLRALVDIAHQKGAPAVVMTFEPHPLYLLAPTRAPAKLSTAERKAELIADCGVDCLIEFPTDRDLLNLDPRDFFDRVIVGEIAARGIIEGPNFCFGRNRAGSIRELETYCSEANIELTVVEGVSRGEKLVSSSAIRQAVAAGELAEAVRMLGHPYRVTGLVEPGAGRGVGLGFGTANLGHIETLLPADGVYGGIGAVNDVYYAAAVHVGSSPTFGETGRRLEAHLIGYDGGALYGQRLSIDLLDRIRDTMRFSEIEALRSQLERDIRHAAEIAGPTLPAAGPDKGPAANRK